MNCCTTIFVKKLLGTSIHSREASHVLMEHLSTEICDQITLDFTGVEFISRSFADQFHFDKLKLVESSNKTILVENINEEIFKILQAVSKPISNSKIQLSNVPVHNYSNYSKLDSYFLSF